MVEDYMMVLSGSRKDLAFSLMCSVYSMGDDYGSMDCPIFHPDSTDTPEKRRLAFLTMCSAYEEADRVYSETEGHGNSCDFRVVFPRPRLVPPSGCGQREPAIRASFSGQDSESQTLELRFSANSREEVDYMVGAVKDWAGKQIVEERDLRD